MNELYGALERAAVASSRLRPSAIALDRSLWSSAKGRAESSCSFVLLHGVVWLLGRTLIDWQRLSIRDVQAKQILASKREINNSHTSCKFQLAPRLTLDDTLPGGHPT